MNASIKHSNFIPLNRANGVAIFKGSPILYNKGACQTVEMLRARLGACLRIRLGQKYVILHSGSFTVYIFLASSFGFCLEN